MDNSMFRKLTLKEIKEFKEYARKNYKPGNEINIVWHPAARIECEKMNLEEINLTKGIT